MTDETEVVDGEAIDETEPGVDRPEHPEPGTDLVPAGAGGAVIIRADDPDEILEKAGKIATALKRLIDGQNLAVNVGGRRKHVEVGGWQALGAMLGALGGQPLHAETVWTRPVCDEQGRHRRTSYHVHEVRYPNGKGAGKPVVERDYDVDGLDWEAHVEIRTAAGGIVGSAEAMCSRAESTWADRPDPAVRSMAETRAESRAYRRAAGWIVHMAGYSPTPAEEMPPDAGAPAWALEAPAALATTAKKALIYLAGDDKQEAARVWGELAALAANGGDEQIGFVPAATAKAIAKIGGMVQRRQAAAAQDAAEDPDPPPAAAVPEGPAPGTLEATAENVAAHCICPKKGQESINDACPISTHGIPF